MSALTLIKKRFMARFNGGDNYPHLTRHDPFADTPRGRVRSRTRLRSHRRQHGGAADQ
jgi:hypothetical protein